MEKDSYVRQRYVPEYFYNHAEPHRRRSAIVDFPCTLWHVGLYHPHTGPQRQSYAATLRQVIQEHFADWRVVQSFSDDRSLSAEDRFVKLNPEFLDLFFNQPWFTGKSAGKDEDPDTVFCFEVQPAKHHKWTIRFELHTEYLTLSVYTRFAFATSPAGNVSLTTYRWDPGETGYSEVRHRIPALRAKTVAAYRQAVAQVVDPTALLLRNGFVADPDMTEAAPDDSPICDAIRQIVSASGDKSVFCDFRGIVTDWTLFKPFLAEAPAKRSRAAALMGQPPAFIAPDFCDSGINRFPADTNFSRTQRFLGRIWPVLIKSVLRPASENLVGCYLQGGHAIYLSALGAQGLPPSSSGRQLAPLQFMLIYDAARADHDEGDNADRWRLSRLVNRLVEVGVRRSASLRNLRYLRDATDKTKEIEKQLEALIAGRSVSEDKLFDLMHALKQVYRVHTETLFYRVNRSGLHYSAMMNLVEDLDIVKIPGWHPYDQFVKRRLASTHESNLGLVDRLRKLEERIRGLQQFTDSFPTKPQKLITLFAFAIAFAALGGELMEAAGSWPRPAALAALNEVLLPYSKPIGMLVGGAVGFATGGFLSRSAKRAHHPRIGPSRWNLLPRLRARRTRRPRQPGMN